MTQTDGWWRRRQSRSRCTRRRPARSVLATPYHPVPCIRWLTLARAGSRWLTLQRMDEEGMALKDAGNQLFGRGEWEAALAKYAEAVAASPRDSKNIAIFKANAAACRIKQASSRTMSVARGPPLPTVGRRAVAVRAPNPGKVRRCGEAVHGRYVQSPHLHGCDTTDDVVLTGRWRMFAGGNRQPCRSTVRTPRPCCGAHRHTKSSLASSISRAPWTVRLASNGPSNRTGPRTRPRIERALESNGPSNRTGPRTRPRTRPRIERALERALESNGPPNGPGSVAYLARRITPRTQTTSGWSSWTQQTRKPRPR